MAQTFYVNMQKRADGKVYADLHKAQASRQTRSGVASPQPQGRCLRPSILPSSRRPLAPSEPQKVNLTALVDGLTVAEARALYHQLKLMFG